MIELSTDGAVRVLKLNRPPSNSLTPEMLSGIRRALEDAEGEPGVRCLLLASSLPKYFSAGLELEEIFDANGKADIEIFLQLLRTHKALADFPKPTIAALNGYAMLGGWILAMACDFRWMSAETGRCALSEIRFGLSPTDFLIERLKSQGADAGTLKQMVLKGKTIRAEEAYSGRLIDGAVPADELFEHTLGEARKLAKLPPGAYASIKAGLNGRDGDALWERSVAEFRRVFFTPEAQEGLAAMREKRNPRW